MSVTKNPHPPSPTSPPPTDENTWVPSSCTLPTVEQPLRVAEFDQFFADSVQAIRRVDPTRLDLTLLPTTEPQARDLATREVSCCSFFTFDFTPTTDTAGAAALTMTITVPASPTYSAVLDAVEARANTRSRPGA
ncbi:hypothetical protein GCM10009789_13260 [Kribbella sancticallisti]|uniref:Arsenate reductase n=1 Tax=Kribbella sancticallisti TaxID=460087 RepID=A0ABP4NGI6_9ACTN